jgi:tRNA 2-thiouridine synthesizing protein A
MGGPIDQAADMLVDARGLSCPLPLLRARQALMLLAAGSTIRVLATDPAAPRDFEEFAWAAGHELLACEQRDEVCVIVLRKAG